MKTITINQKTYLETRYIEQAIGDFNRIREALVENATYVIAVNFDPACQAGDDCYSVESSAKELLSEAFISHSSAPNKLFHVDGVEEPWLALLWGADKVIGAFDSFDVKFDIFMAQKWNLNRVCALAHVAKVGIDIDDEVMATGVLEKFLNSFKLNELKVFNGLKVALAVTVSARMHQYLDHCGYPLSWLAER